jgi:branched-chain amino acid transport system substrate-binding protein
MRAGRTVAPRVSRSRKVALLAAATAAVIGIAACGSSSGGGSATPSGGTASGGSGGNSSGNNADASQGFTADSITIEGDIIKTSQIGYSEAGADIGAKARFQRANDEGGVNGRKINYLGSIDNKLDPSQSLPVVKKIIQQDKAFAIVPLLDTQLSSGGTYLTQNKVPIFGWGTVPAFCNNDNGFGFTGCLVPTAKDSQVSTLAAGVMEKALGVSDGKGKTVAMISEDSTAGTFGIKVIEAAFVADGWKVTYSKSSIPAGTATTDFTPYAQAIMTSNGGKAPDVVAHITTTPNAVGLTQALTNAGFKGLQENAVTYDPKYLASAQTKAALEGSYVFIQYGDFQNGSDANKQMLADVQKVDPSVKELTQDIAIGYYSADIFLNGLKKTGKQLSRDAFLKAMNDGSTYEVKDGLGAISYPKAHTAAVPCGSLVQIKNGAYKEAVPLACYRDVPLSVLGS